MVFYRRQAVFIFIIERPTDIFTADGHARFVFTFNHFCYEGHELFNKKIHIIVRQINGVPITYGQIFYEIDTQVDNELTNIEVMTGRSNLGCDHMFMESFREIGFYGRGYTKYDISCGS